MQILEVLTVGFPFCGFKLLTGLLLYQGQGDSIALQSLGALLIALAGVDAVVNVANACSLLWMRRRVVDPCFFAFALRAFPFQWIHTKDHAHDLGNSVDVLLSFGLVGAMIASGWLGQLPMEHLTIWNICVVLNVLGAGMARFSASLTKLPRRPLPEA